MSTEDAPLSRTQSTWAHAGEDGENYKLFAVLLFFRYRLCIFCYILVSS